MQVQIEEMVRSMLEAGIEQRVVMGVIADLIDREQASKSAIKAWATTKVAYFESLPEITRAACQSRVEFFRGLVESLTPSPDYDY